MTIAARAKLPVVSCESVQLILNVAEVQWVDSDVRMLVRGHVRGEERQADYVGNSTYQLGQALAAGPAAAADDAYVARKHASTDDGSTV